MSLSGNESPPANTNEPISLSENEKPPADTNWFRSALLLGVSGAMATLITHPFDIVRVQVQSQFVYISPRQVLKNIIKFRGKLGVYFGILTAIKREFAYCTMRFAFYEKARYQGCVEDLWNKMKYACASGFLGGFIATPLSKVSTRIRTDAANPPDVRYNYRKFLHGLRCLYREGGFFNFFYMAKTCAIRGMLMTVCQLLIYHQVKRTLLNQNFEFRRDWERYLVASAIAGALTMIIVTPMDVIEQIGHNVKAKDFRGELNVIRHLASVHGLRGFYRGFMPNFLRIPPQTILTFLIYEKLSLKIMNTG